MCLVVSYVELDQTVKIFEMDEESISSRVGIGAERLDSLFAAIAR